MGTNEEVGSQELEIVFGKKRIGTNVGGRKIRRSLMVQGKDPGTVSHVSQQRFFW